MGRRRALGAMGRVTAAGWLWAHGLSGLARASASGPTVFGGGRTRIALVLPGADGAFRTASAAVRAGVQAAHLRDGRGIAVELFVEPATYEETVALYQSLAARSFQLVIGPLTRDAVNLLGDVGRLAVPTLTLNLPDPGAAVPDNTVLFGLSVESEARQIAQFAFKEATRRSPWRRSLVALCVSSPSPLGQRSAHAFLEAWRALGGTALDSIETDTRVFSELRAELGNARADTYFVALHPEVAAMVRTVFGDDAAVYGTSSLNMGLAAVPGAAVVRAPAELDGVRLVAMPWQIDPGSPAVMAYPRSRNVLPHVELQRLYALGIDAFRVARELLANNGAFEIDGVTGRLRFDARSSVLVEREMLIAQFRDGVVVSLEAR